MTKIQIFDINRCLFTFDNVIAIKLELICQNIIEKAKFSSFLSYVRLQRWYLHNSL